MGEKRRYIELLAPAKDLQSAVDAIDCGADAVYIGAAKFGARYAATNSVDDIAEAVHYAHRYGAKVYATLNTLIFDDELEDAKAQAEALVAAGVDALIVQDMAYCRMGLGVPLHASTQTSCSTVEQVRFFEQTGFARAILERNLSGAQIESIGRGVDIELEAFIHGAICVCHSGRCALSRSMSGRSGNRGECSQPCRLPYDLTDGEGTIYIKGKHLLSVCDLDLTGRIGQMIDAGVNSFKIEGRLKDRVYLRNIVSHYRRILDREIDLRAECARASVGRSVVEFEPNPAKSFTRGGSLYLFDGKRNGVASFDTPKALGERLGRVARVAGSRFMIDSAAQVATGDGICFISDGEAVGTAVNGVDGVWITPNRMDGIRVGTEIYRNYDRLFSLAVERSRNRRQVDATVAVRFAEQSITATATDCTGMSATVTVEYASEVAQGVAKMENTVRTQLSKSGQTMFAVVDVRVEDVRFAPASVLTQLRRDLLEALEQRRVESHRRGAPFAENLSARFHKSAITEQENVTNALARSFYADHGVQSIAEGIDLQQSTAGCRVMVTDYCIRREIGQCLLKNPTIRGEIYLERGRKKYKLSFDCKRCQMSLIDTL
ncbi:MAG: U32 family peptidase [Alistipes sp.]|nr:U32 family peptidase [Alistipes sp.]